MSLFNWRSDPVKREFLIFHKSAIKSLRNIGNQFLSIDKSKQKNIIKIVHLKNILRTMENWDYKLCDAQGRFRNEPVDVHVFIKLRREFEAIAIKIREEISILEKNKN